MSNTIPPKPPSTFIGQFQNYDSDYEGYVPGSSLVAAAGHPLAGGNIPGAIAGVTPGCGICPDYVLNVLTGDVISTLSKVRRVKNIVTILNQAITAFSSDLINFINSLVDLIPHPPLLDPLAIIKLAGCPLTPIMLAIQQEEKLQAKIAEYTRGLDAFNPAYYVGVGRAFTDYQKETTFETVTQPFYTLIRAFINSFKEYMKYIERLIDEFFNTLNDRFGQFLKNIVKTFWRLIRVIRDICGHPAELSLSIAVTAASVNLVKATCPNVYARPDLPFASFAREMASFSFNGLLPSGLTETAQPIFLAFMKIEVRILEWQSAILVMSGLI